MDGSGVEQVLSRTYLGIYALAADRRPPPKSPVHGGLCAQSLLHFEGLPCSWERQGLGEPGGRAQCVFGSIRIGLWG